MIWNEPFRKAEARRKGGFAMRQSQSSSRRRLAAALAAALLVGVFATTFSACATHVETAAGGGGGSMIDAGPPCQGPEDCDSKSYCEADDQNCGPGHCRKRPRVEGDPNTDFYCGCDGVVYATPEHARAAGFDVGDNSRCTVDPADFFVCGPRMLCRGSGKCCGSDAEPCASQHYCLKINGQDLPVSNCDRAVTGVVGVHDPKYCGCDLQCLLDNLCNFSYPKPKFHSVTCQELCNGEYVIDCKE